MQRAVVEEMYLYGVNFKGIGIPMPHVFRLFALRYFHLNIWIEAWDLGGHEVLLFVFYAVLDGATY